MFNFINNLIHNQSISVKINGQFSNVLFNNTLNTFYLQLYGVTLKVILSKRLIDGGKIYLL